MFPCKNSQPNDQLLEAFRIRPSITGQWEKSSREGIEMTDLDYVSSFWTEIKGPVNTNHLLRQSHFILCRIHKVRFELEVIILNLFKSIVLDIQLKTYLGTDHIYNDIYILSRFCLKKSSFFGPEKLMSQQKCLFIQV